MWSHVIKQKWKLFRDVSHLFFVVVVFLFVYLFVFCLFMSEMNFQFTGRANIISPAAGLSSKIEAKKQVNVCRGQHFTFSSSHTHTHTGHVISCNLNREGTGKWKSLVSWVSILSRRGRWRKPVGWGTVSVNPTFYYLNVKVCSQFSLCEQQRKEMLEWTPAEFLTAFLLLYTVSVCVFVCVLGYFLFSVLCDAVHKVDWLKIFVKNLRLSSRSQRPNED